MAKIMPAMEIVGAYCVNKLLFWGICTILNQNL